MLMNGKSCLIPILLFFKTPVQYQQCMFMLCFRMNSSEMIRQLVSRCGPEDTNDLWYNTNIHRLTIKYPKRLGKFLLDISYLSSIVITLLGEGRAALYVGDISVKSISSYDIHPQLSIMCRDCSSG